MKDLNSELEYYRRENNHLRQRLLETEGALGKKFADKRRISFDKIDEMAMIMEHPDELLRLLIQDLNTGAVTLTREGVIVFCNASVAALLKLKLENIVGLPFYDFICPEFWPLFDAFLAQREVDPMRTAIHLQASDGSIVPVGLASTMFPVRDHKDYRFLTVTCLTGVINYLSLKKHESGYEQKQIEYLRYHDQLTGLHNRRFLEEEIRRLDAIRNLPLTYVVADVNGLKTINDAFGPQVGDQLLKIVASVIKDECRKSDRVARIGGGEFAILLTGDSDSAENIMSRLKRRIEKEKINGIDITISFGWRTKNHKDQDLQGLMTEAEDSMYRSKILEKASRKHSLIRMIQNTLHLKNPRENNHSQRVSLYAEKLAKQLKLSENNIKEIKTAAELHDIGKIAIDEAILNKKGALSPTEWLEIKKHPEIGFRLLSTSAEFHKISQYVLSHHEMWDGSGYPNGIKGKDIPIEARIVGICDAYDAMISVRTYRVPMSVNDAKGEILKKAGRQFDPYLARIFVERVVDDEQERKAQ